MDTFILVELLDQQITLAKQEMEQNTLMKAHLSLLLDVGDSDTILLLKLAWLQLRFVGHVIGHEYWLSYYFMFTPYQPCIMVL